MEPNIPKETEANSQLNLNSPEDFKLNKPSPEDFKMTSTYSDKESNVGTIKNNIALNAILSEDPVGEYQRNFQQYLLDETNKGYEIKAKELYASQKGERVKSFWDSVTSGLIPEDEVVDRLAQLHDIEADQFRLPKAILKEMSDKNMISKEDLSTTDGIYTAFASSVDTRMELSQRTTNRIATLSSNNPVGLFTELFVGTALQFLPTNELSILRDIQEEFKDDVPMQNEKFSIWTLDNREILAEGLSKMPFPQREAMKKAIGEAYLKKSGILVDNPYQTVEFLKELETLTTSDGPEFADRMLDYVFQTIDHVEEFRMASEALRMSGKAVGRAFSKTPVGFVTKTIGKLKNVAKTTEAIRFAGSSEAKFTHWSDYSRARNAEFKANFDIAEASPTLALPDNSTSVSIKGAELSTVPPLDLKVPYLNADLDELIMGDVARYLSGAPQPISPIGIARISNPEVATNLIDAANSSDEAAEVLTASNGNDLNYSVDYPEWNTGGTEGYSTGRIDGDIMTHPSFSRGSRDLRQIVGTASTPQGGINFTVDEVLRAKNNIEEVFATTPTASYSISASKIGIDGDTLSINAVFLKNNGQVFTSKEEVMEAIAATESRFPRVDGEFSIGLPNGDGTYTPLNLQEFNSLEANSPIPMNDYAMIWTEKSNVNPSDLKAKDWDKFMLRGTVFDRNSISDGRITQNILDPATFLDPHSYKAALRTVLKEQAVQHRFNKSVDSMDKIRRSFSAEQDVELAKYLRSANLNGKTKSQDELYADGFSEDMVDYTYRFKKFWDEIWYLENKDVISRHRAKGNKFVNIMKVGEDGFSEIDYKLIGRPITSVDLNVGGASSPKILDLSEAGSDLSVSSIQFRDADGVPIPNAVSQFDEELRLQNKVIYKLSEPLSVTPEGRGAIKYRYILTSDDNVENIQSTSAIVPYTEGVYTTIYTDPYFLTKGSVLVDKRTGNIVGQVEDVTAHQSAPVARTIRDKLRAISGDPKASISTPVVVREAVPEDVNLELVTTHKVVTNVNSASKRTAMIEQLNTNVNSATNGKLFSSKKAGVPDISERLRSNIFDRGALLSPVDAMLTVVGDLGSKGDTRAYLNSVESRWINQFGNLTGNRYPTDVSQINLQGSDATKHVADAKAMFNYVQSIKLSALSEVDELVSAQIRTFANSNEGSVIINKTLLWAADYQIISRGKRFASETQLILHPLRRWGMASADISRIWAVNPKNPDKTALAVADTTKVIGAMIHRFRSGQLPNTKAGRLLRELESTGLVSGIDKNFLIESGLRDNYRVASGQAPDLGSRTTNTSRLKNTFSSPSKATAGVASNILPHVAASNLSDVVKYAGQVPSEWLQLTTAYMAFRQSVAGSANELTKEQLEQVSALASNFSFAMNRAGTLLYNEGMLSPVFQYVAVVHKGTLQIVGGVADGEDFSFSGGDTQTPSASEGKGTGGRPVLASSQRAALSLNLFAIAGGMGIYFDSLVDQTINTLLEDTDMTREQVQEVSDALTMGAIVYSIQAIENTMSMENSKLNFNDVIQLDTDIIYKAFVLGTSLVTGDSANLEDLFRDSPIGQSYGKMFSIGRDIANTLTSTDDEYIARIKAISELYMNLSSGYSSYTRAKAAVEYGKLLNSKGVTVDIYLTPAETVAVGLGFKTMDEARSYVANEDINKSSKSMRDDAKRWYEDYKRIFLGDVATDSDELIHKEKSMNAAARIFKDQVPMLELIKSYIVNDINNGDTRFIAHIFKNKGFILSDNILPYHIINAIQDPVKRAEVEAMLKDLRIQGTYTLDPSLEAKEEAKFEDSVGNNPKKVKSSLKKVRDSKPNIKFPTVKDTSVGGANTKFKTNETRDPERVKKLLEQIRSKNKKGEK